jgi:integral membrane sensor domain MASE1
MPERRLLRDLIHCLVLALLYVGAAKLGLRYATIAKSVTLVWPPTGLALAAVVLVGPRLWPGIALGAFLSNAATPGVPLGSAAAIAAGNTLEAVGSAYFLRYLGFNPSLARIVDVFGLLLVAVLATMVSATIGTAALLAGGGVALGEVARTWIVWWLGDALGSLAVAPLFLTWGSVPRPRRPSLLRGVEAAALMVSLVIIGLSVFGLISLIPVPDYPQPYTIFPFLLWAALRFGQRGITTVDLVAWVITTSATVHGSGPFVRSTLDESLLFLQTFMGVTMITALLLGAAIAERNRAIDALSGLSGPAPRDAGTPRTGPG